MCDGEQVAETSRDAPHPILRPRGGVFLMSASGRKRTLKTAIFQALERPYMDSPSFASKLWVADMARLHTYIRPLSWHTFIDAGP